MTQTPDSQPGVLDIPDVITVYPADHLEGTVTAPGDKVASVHLSLAAVVNGAATRIDNIHYCGDVLTIYDRLASLGLAAIDVSDKDVNITPQHQDNVDLSVLSDTRSNICLVAPLALRGSTVRFKGTAGCTFTSRATDRHFALMDAFGLEVVHNGELYEITGSEPNSSVNFDCSTESGVPSVGVTCHALMASLVYDREVTLTNIALEAAPIALIDYIRQSTNREVEVEGRTVRLSATQGIVYRPSEIMLPPDVTVAATYLGALAAAGSGEVTIESISLGDIPTSLLESYRQAGIRIAGMGATAIKAELKSHALTMPADVICEAWPGFPTDIAPILAASVAGVGGDLVVTDGIYDKRSAHVEGLNIMGYSLEAAGNTVTVHGQAPKLVGEVTVEAPDIRSGAALLVGALGSKAQRVRISSYRQIHRGYSNLLESLRTLGAVIERG